MMPCRLVANDVDGDCHMERLYDPNDDGVLIWALLLLCMAVIEC